MASFFGKYGLQGFPLSGRFAPKPLGLFLLEALAVSKPVLLGLRGPAPAPFLSTAKEKGEKKRRQGSAPEPLPPSLLHKRLGGVT